MMEKALAETGGWQTNWLTNCKFTMAKQSDKTPMTLIACKNAVIAVWYHKKSTDESPDRDFKPVSWLPSPQGIYEKVYESQKFTLCTRSKFRLVEHSTIICNGKIQHQLLNQEYSFTITQRLFSTTHRKDRAVFTQNALKPTPFSTPTRPRSPRKRTASNQPRTRLPLKN